MLSLLDESGLCFRVFHRICCGEFEVRSLVRLGILSNDFLLVNHNYFERKLAEVVYSLARDFTEKWRGLAARFMIKFDTKNKYLKV